MLLARRITTGISVIIAIGLGIWASTQPPRWQVISAYGTALTGRTNAQIHNLEIAVKSIDGKLIPPGGEFSFNRTVGSWTSERGYVKAPVSFDGELIPAWGGGVCQASSTLYNAALYAGLDIKERHRHRFPAKYVPIGRDAAVAQYDIDLRLRNPFKWPVKIEAKILGERAVCRILAQHKPGNEIIIESEVNQITAPGEVIRASSKATGERMRIINHGQPGMHVLVYRRTADGPHNSRKLISENTYPPMNRLIKVE